MAKGSRVLAHPASNIGVIKWYIVTPKGEQQTRVAIYSTTFQQVPNEGRVGVYHTGQSTCME